MSKPYKADANYLKDDNGWYAILKFLMQGLVMPYFYTEISTDASTNYSQP